MQNQDDPIINPPTVIDAEEVSTDIPSNDAEVLLNMENLIKNHVSQIDKIGAELAEQKTMLADIFANDPIYQEHEQAAKEANKVKIQTKAQILKQPQAAQIAAQAKSLTSEVKELRQALSDYLREYARMTGANEIQGEDGEMREIVYTVKLVKKSIRH